MGAIRGASLSVGLKDMRASLSASRRAQSDLAADERVAAKIVRPPVAGAP
jgi:hypothetical protein